MPETVLPYVRQANYPQVKHVSLSLQLEPDNAKTSSAIDVLTIR